MSRMWMISCVVDEHKSVYFVLREFMDARFEQRAELRIAIAQVPQDIIHHIST